MVEFKGTDIFSDWPRRSAEALPVSRYRIVIGYTRLNNGDGPIGSSERAQEPYRH